MVSRGQERRERNASRAYTLALVNTGVLILTFVFSAGWQIYQKHSYGSKFASIDASLRLLTATVVPQLLQAVDDNLKAALSEPSTQQLQVSQTFAKVESDTAKLRKLNAKLPASKVIQSAALLEKAVSLHPDTLDGWGAAAQMVSYRSDLRTEPVERPDCFKTQGPGDWDRAKLVRYHDCTLDISNVAEFWKVEPAFLPQGMRFSDRLRFYVTVELVNGTVSYSGGEMIHITKLICQNCSFDFRPGETVPPPPGRFLSQQLLTADLNDVSVTLPQG